MRLSSLLATTLSLALAAVFLARLLNSAPSIATTTMPLRLEQDSNKFLAWGEWKFSDQSFSIHRNSVEIRCSRLRMTCSEALATLLQHDDGMDLEAHAFSYQVTGWNDKKLEAVADGGLGLCTERRLIIDLVAKSAQLQWEPGPGCETDSGNAVLVGGPS